MRNTLLSLAIAGVGSYFYLNHPLPTAHVSGAATGLPDGHHHAPEGVYYLRTAYTVPTQGGSVRWASGQTLFEDRRVSAAPSNGMVSVTDGTYSTQVLGSMLSQDVEEGQSLRAAGVSADINTRALADQARMRTDMQARSASVSTYVSPLEQPSERRVVGGVYYNGGYSSTVVVRDVRNSYGPGNAQPHGVIAPHPVYVAH